MYPDSTVSSGWSHITTPFIGCPSKPGWLTGFYTFNESGGPPLIMVFYGTSVLYNDTSNPAYGMQYDGTAWTAVQLSTAAADLLQLNQGQLLMSIPVDIGEAVPRALVYGVALNNEDLGCLTYFLGPEPKTNIWSVYYASSYPTYSSFVQAGWLPGDGLTVLTSPNLIANAGTYEWLWATIDWSNASISGNGYVGTAGAAEYGKPL
jgi:hypothetical protein